MRILFVAPPLPRANTPAPPLGFCYLAAVLRQNGFSDVAILDACSLNLSVSQTIDAIRQHAPDVLGLTTMTPTVKNALKIAAATSEHLPRVRVAVGGVHATVCPDEVIADPNVDVVVRNEGENAFLEVVRRWDSGQTLGGVLGTSHRTGDTVVHESAAPRILDLDALPFPARDLLPMDIYKAGLSFPPRIRTRTTFYSARGCPNDCSFCSTAAVWGGHRCVMRSAESMLDEIQEVVDRFGVYGFEFADELTTLSKRRLEAFCDGIHRRRLERIRWVCSSTVKQMDYATARMMREAGCSMVMFGVESGSPDILRTLNKPISVDETIAAFDATRRAGLRRCAMFMIGTPGETENTVDQSIALARRIRPDRIGLYILTPYPGTRFYDQYVDKEKPLDWDLATCSNPDDPSEATIFCNISGLTDDELRRLWLKFRRSTELSLANLANWRMQVNRLTNARSVRQLGRNMAAAVRILLHRS